MTKANEHLRYSMVTTEEEKYIDKQIFVDNLGWLLSQTINDVRCIKLQDDATAVVVYNSGTEQTVNIACDSYTAIINDIVKEVL